ncbi:PE family protein PE3 [Mycobacterium simulans]|uniref:PE family protein PE3 n=1 Tax=Mycobacterium simulans TaxID=627089 RepID=A0A7Z7N7N5_9MYCO|nr:PE-PPE domain-containing protein [Mycobacterium simulans]SOJ52783.1 PE family protein PE3 [Mycobacterium simulans]
MSYVFTAPEMLVSAAANVDGIASTIHAANAAAAAPISGVIPAAEDEVSAATAALFNAYAQDYQAVIKQAAAFQDEFTRTLAAAANAYQQAEATNAALVNGAVTNAVKTINAPIRSLMGQAPLGAGASSGIGTVAAAESALLADPIVALIMGGTNNPLPSAEYVTDINKRFIQPLFTGATPQGLFTPEQFWPVTPDLGNMTFNQSVAKGVSLLSTAVTNELNLGNSVVAFGYSQSATIVNNYINNLMALGAPNADKLAFTMIGSPNNPVGGLLARFPGFYIPFLDVSFNGATPANTPYETYIYTAQYDGIAHAPQYPLHILSDINAFMGYFYVHGDYPLLTPEDMSNAVLLPTSPGYAGNTKYYMLLTQDLPLVQPIRDIPYAGPVLADLIQPQLRVLVDLGYADYGPGGNYADIPTPAGLFSIPNPFAVTYYLALGSLQAPYGAAVEIGVQAGLWGPEWFPDTYPWVPSINPGLNFYFGQPQVTALSLLSGGLGNVLHLIPPILN